MTQKQAHFSTSSQDAFLAATQENLQTLEEMGAKFLTGLEKVAAYNVIASKAAVQSAVEHAKSLLASKSVQEALSVQMAMIQPLSEQVMVHGKQLHSLVRVMGGELLKAAEIKQSQAQAALASAVDQMVRTAPAESQHFARGVKNAFGAGHDAMESVQKNVKAAASNLNRKFTEAAEQASKTVKRGHKDGH